MENTEYGGKNPPTWMANGFHLPGYRNAFLSIVSKETGEEMELQFMVSPSALSEARSKLYQLIKTMGGWVVQKLGKRPIEISISGYMLDMKGVNERHDFLDNYKNYIEDQKNYSGDYYNKYYTKLTIEGREYYGLVSGLSFSKQAAGSPFLYSYSMSFIALGEKRIYDVVNSNADVAMINQQILGDTVQKNIVVSDTVATTLGLTDSSGTNAITKTNVNTVESDTSGISICNYANIGNSQYLVQKIKIDTAKVDIKTQSSIYSTYGVDISNIEGSVEFTKISLPNEIKNDIFVLKALIQSIGAKDGEFILSNETDDWAVETDSPRRTAAQNAKQKAYLLEQKCYSLLKSLESSEEPSNIVSSAKKCLTSILSLIGGVYLKLDIDEDMMDTYMHAGGYGFIHEYLEKPEYEIPKIDAIMEQISGYCK